MEIAVYPPRILIAIAVGAPIAFAVLVLALTRGKPLLARLAPIVLAGAAGLFVVALAWRPARFGWGEGGIVDDGFGRSRTVAWSAIHEARLVRSWAGTEYALAARTNGIAHEGIRAGEFRLANGAAARVFAVPDQPDAIVLRTDDGLCVYAPSSFEAFVAALRAHGVAVP